MEENTQQNQEVTQQNEAQQPQQEAQQPQQQENQATESQTRDQDLILGKFKDYKALEEAYENLQKRISSSKPADSSTKNDLGSNQDVVQDYKQTAALDDIDTEVLGKIRTEARDLGLSQTQFEKYARKVVTSLQPQQQTQDQVVDNASQQQVEQSRPITAAVSNSNSSYDFQSRKIDAYNKLKEAQAMGDMAKANLYLSQWVELSNKG